MSGQHNQNIESNISLTEVYLRKARLMANLADSSICKYRESLNKFYSTITNDIEKLEIKDIENFILTMKDAGASNSRIANVVSAVKWLVVKMQKDNLLLHLNVEDIKKPRIRKKPVVYLSELEIEKFLQAIRKDIEKGKTTKNTRMLALVTLLLQTGARIGEALSMNIAEINRDDMEVDVIGKGEKYRTLYLRDDTLNCIDQYLETRNDDCPYLFVTLEGKSQWQQTDVGRSFRRYRKLSEIKKQFTLHTLRHTFGTQLTLKGVPINTIQHFLGHANLDTTTRYYIGALEKKQAKEYIKDRYFDFIP